MKGIILAGGIGTRLLPLTKCISKQLLPIADKPMIYYPLSTLMQLKIKDIAIISTPIDIPRFQMLLGDGSNIGINISYIEQPSPDGIAQAFILAEKFIGTDNVCLILGDNIFVGYDFESILQKYNIDITGLIFGCYVNNPERYGVLKFNQNKQPVQIIEKPKQFCSNHAIPGLYFYNKNVIEIAKKINPSSRGELEITDIHNYFLIRGQLKIELLDRGSCWLDAGTHESLQQATQYISVIENRHGIKIGCIEEIAYKNGYIDKQQLLMLAKSMDKSEYGNYLLGIINE